MNAVGIIAEYNPFHNGHKWQLQQARSISGAEAVVAVMSGPFLQRGIPALMDKWTRAEAAVRCGADVVVELPVLYACASAEHFASGAVHLLKSLQVSHLCFGSEAGHLDQLQQAASLFAEEPESFRLQLRAGLDKGLSYAAARGKALAQHLPEAETLLKQPNNILGIEYLKAILRQQTALNPVTVQRIAAGYHSTVMEGSICSATAIRQALHRDSFSPDQLKDFMPSASWHLIDQRIRENRILTEEAFFNLIQYRLMLLSPNDFTRFPDAEEGLWNRILNASPKIRSYEELVTQVQTRRYPRTRVQRLLTAVLLDMPSDSRSRLGLPGYARILGTSSVGRSYLKSVRKDIALPLISNLGRFTPNTPETAAMLAMDVRAADIYQSVMPNAEYRIRGTDYTVPMPYHGE